MQSSSTTQFRKFHINRLAAVLDLYENPSGRAEADQAGLTNAFAAARRRCVKNARPQNPNIIIAQVDGSGTADVGEGGSVREALWTSKSST